MLECGKKLKVKLNNVALRSFLYLLDQRNLKKELSNTTVCDYILSSYPALAREYKDSASFRSGYAGNFSLLFDAASPQDGKMNKLTKTLEAPLQNAMKRLVSAKLSFVEGKTAGTSYCFIENIPDDEVLQTLSVFFVLKPINAALRLKINDEKTGWLVLLQKKLKISSNFAPNPAVSSGRGQTGTTAILSRYTIFNLGGNWFDVLKPAYYNFKNLRYKLFLHSLMIEQPNLYYVIPKAARYDFDCEAVFKECILIKNDEPLLKSDWFSKNFSFTDVLIVKKVDFCSLIVDKVKLPESLQYQFTVVGNTLLFASGEMIDLTPFLVNDKKVLEESSSFNPNITFDLERENLIRRSSGKSFEKQTMPIRRLQINGEESNTIMKFIEKSFLGKLRINDYTRSENGLIVTGERKTCLILYNGTKFPDLVCIFAEDAERTEARGKRTYPEYASYIWSNYDKFRHKMFMVEAEFNLQSFKSHDVSADYVKQSRYIFCENRSAEFYESKFGVHIPAVSIKDLP